VVEPKKKKIDAKQFAQDIAAGMHDSALMAAYGLSQNELKRAMQKLEERGLLKHPQPLEPRPEPQRPRPAPIERRPKQAAPKQEVFECPSCGGVHSERFDECPHCGIVLSKFYGQGPSSGPQTFPDEDRLPSSPVRITPSVKENNHILTFVGIGVIIVFLVCGGLYYRSMKKAEIQSMIHNVESVLNQSNGPTVPNYTKLAKIFGDATGSMAAVLESRKAPYTEKMHELYQKMVYLGDLQQRMQWRGPGSVKGLAAYRNAAQGARAYGGAVNKELDSLAQTLDTERRALAGASDGGGMAGEAEAQQVLPRAQVPSRPSSAENDQTVAQFDKAQDELRSLCTEVLSILAAQ
jgi:hypothetical protein